MSARLHLLGNRRRSNRRASNDHHDRHRPLLAEAVLVDCGGDVLQRAMQAGIPIENIRAVILTHEHPDHVGGWALFVEKVWLHGRRVPIPVYGPDPALVQAERNFGIYDTARWEGVPEVFWNSCSS